MWKTCLAELLLLLVFFLLSTTSKKAVVYRYYYGKSANDISTCTRQTVLLDNQEWKPSSGQCDANAIRNVTSEVVRENFEKIKSSQDALETNLNEIKEAITTKLTGKSGAVGAKGDEGAKGAKGEPGIPDNSVVEQLRDEIAALQTKQREVDSRLSEMRARFFRLNDGWVGLFNGYQYKLFNSTQNYTSSRALCRRNGADLAVYGVQDAGNIKLLDEAFQIRAGKRSVYIGMNDIDEEDRWKWVDDSFVHSDVLALWGANEPDGGRQENCVALYYEFLLRVDTPCTEAHSTLCEKKWT